MSLLAAALFQAPFAVADEPTRQNDPLFIARTESEIAVDGEQRRARGAEQRLVLPGLRLQAPLAERPLPGYGDFRSLDVGGRYQEAGEQLFLKVSYAFQR